MKLAARPLARRETDFVNRARFWMIYRRKSASVGSRWYSTYNIKGIIQGATRIQPKMGTRKEETLLFEVCFVVWSFESCTTPLAFLLLSLILRVDRVA